MNHQGAREQGNEEWGRVERLLREALPPVGDQPEGGQDLWPAMQRRLRAGAEPVLAKVGVPWFDWALAGVLALLLVMFPAWIPVLLYYL